MIYAKAMDVRDDVAMTTAAAPRRGRPPRYSRETIVDAVAEMLLADPTAPLTIARCGSRRCQADVALSPLHRPRRPRVGRGRAAVRRHPRTGRTRHVVAGRGRGVDA